MFYLAILFIPVFPDIAVSVVELQVQGKVIYTKYSKHSNETNTFMGLGRAGRFGQS